MWNPGRLTADSVDVPQVVVVPAVDECPVVDWERTSLDLFHSVLPPSYQRIADESLTVLLLPLLVT